MIGFTLLHGTQKSPLDSTLKPCEPKGERVRVHPWVRNRVASLEYTLWFYFEGIPGEDIGRERLIDFLIPYSLPVQWSAY